jgi:hypothetical protein
VTVQYVYNSLEADADAINELIKDRLEEMSDEYQAYIEHELIYMSEFDTECPYDKLNNVKTSYSNTLYDIQSKIWTLEGKLSDEQILLAEDIAIGEEQKAEEKTADRDKDEIEEDANADAFALTLHKKYIVIGAVVGILLMAVFIVVRECISVKLASADELSDYFMLPVIGSFEKPEGKKRFLHVVDDWLISLKERHHKKLTYEQQLENIVTAIGVRCEQEGIGELCMTGTCLLDIDKTMTDDIGQQLKKCYDIKTVFVDNISYNAEALKVCSEIGNAVILEIVGTSIEDEIERQLLMLKEYNVNVLGAIAV